MQLTLPVILILGLLSGLTPLAIDAYLPSLPTIARSLNTDINLIQLTISVYLIIFAIFQLLFGPISDAYGRRRVIVFGLVVFFIGSLMCAFANDYALLMTGRAIQAFGGAAVAVCIPALVKDGLSTEQFAKAMSYVMLVMAIAPLIAPILGGAILVIFNWHYIFLFLSLVACLALLLFIKNIPETLTQDKRSVLSFANALGNYRRLLKNPGVMSHIIAGALHFSGMMCFITGASFVYIEFYGINPEHFGFLFGLNVVAMMLITTLNSQLVERIGTQTMARYGMLLMVFSSLMLAGLAFMQKPPLWSLVVASGFFVGTLGILGSGLMAGALNHAGSHNGSVTALAGTIRFTSGAISGVAVSLLHNDTFVPMVGIMAATGLLSFACYWGVARHVPMPITTR